MMKKLYDKSELGFALVWIGIYCVGMSIFDEISRRIGVESSATAIFGVAVSLLLYFWLKRQGKLERFGLCKPTASAKAFLFYIPLTVITLQNIWGGVALAVLLVYPFGRKAAQDQLQSIGLANHAGMASDLLRKRRDRDNPRVTVWEIRNQSIPLTVWEDKRAAIEATLDVSIVKMVYGKSKGRVLVYVVPTQTCLPEVLRWSDAYLSPDSFVLTLGESLTGPVTVNLAHIPHILLGGSHDTEEENQRLRHRNTLP